MPDRVVKKKKERPLALITSLPNWVIPSNERYESVLTLPSPPRPFFGTYTASPGPLNVDAHPAPWSFYFLTLLFFFFFGWPVDIAWSGLGRMIATMACPFTHRHSSSKVLGGSASGARGEWVETNSSAPPVESKCLDRRKAPSVMSSMLGGGWRSRELVQNIWIWRTTHYLWKRLRKVVTVSPEISLIRSMSTLVLTAATIP